MKKLREQDEYRRNKGIRCIFRGVLTAVLLIAICGTLSGCYSTDLAEGFDEDTIIETAKEIINEVQMNGAKQVLTERMREDYLGNIDLDAMENTVISLTEGKGDFLTYGKKSVIGRYHEEAEEDFAVIYVTVKYENGEINYTITFDKDMKVVGFYAA